MAEHMEPVGDRVTIQSRKLIRELLDKARQRAHERWVADGYPDDAYTEYLADELHKVRKQVRGYAL